MGLYRCISFVIKSDGTHVSSIAFFLGLLKNRYNLKVYARSSKQTQKPANFQREHESLRLKLAGLWQIGVCMGKPVYAARHVLNSVQLKWLLSFENKWKTICILVYEYNKEMCNFDSHLNGVFKHFVADFVLNVFFVQNRADLHKGNASVLQTRGAKRSAFQAKIWWLFATEEERTFLHVCQQQALVSICPRYW